MTDAKSQLEKYPEFDEIEEAFHAALDVSLDPRGPDSLHDLVARFGLPSGSAVVDVGCGSGRHAVELARRFGFDVLAVDPDARRAAAVRNAANQLPGSGGTVRFEQGTAEAIPVVSSSIDLIWCRESLMFADLPAAASEFSRVLHPGGRGLVYLVLPGPLMSDAEAADFCEPEDGRQRDWGGLGSTSRALRPRDIEQAMAGTGLVIDEHVDFASEWGERAQEEDGSAGRRLLYAARLLRRPESYIARFGQDNYDIMLGDCLWHVYRMIGKLSGYACVFTKP